MVRLQLSARVMTLASIALLFATAASSSECTFYVPDFSPSSPTGCLAVDLSAMFDPAHPAFTLHDSYPMTYSVAAPCHNVSYAAHCTACAERPGDAPAFAHGGSPEKCYALGRLGSASAERTATGIRVTYGDGDSLGLGGPRQLIYDLICDDGAAGKKYRHHHQHHHVHVRQTQLWPGV